MLLAGVGRTDLIDTDSATWLCGFDNLPAHMAPDTIIELLFLLRRFQGNHSIYLHSLRDCNKFPCITYVGKSGI